MTPKELLYVEDALSHAQFLMTQCREAAGQLRDGKLRAEVQQMIRRNETVFDKFYGLV